MNWITLNFPLVRSITVSSGYVIPSRSVPIGRL